MFAIVTSVVTNERFQRYFNRNFRQMDGNRSVLIWVIGIFCSMDFIRTNRFYDLFPKPFVCKALDPHIVHNYTCITKEIIRTLHLNSREIIFHPGVTVNNYYIDIQIMRKIGSVYRQMMQIEQDMCDFTRGNSSRDSSILAKILNKDGRMKYGNMFEPCPLSGRRYEIDAVIDYSKMPDVVPAGEYRIDIFGYTIINGKKTQFILTQCNTNDHRKGHEKDE